MSKETVFSPDSCTFTFESTALPLRAGPSPTPSEPSARPKFAVYYLSREDPYAPNPLRAAGLRRAAPRSTSTGRRIRVRLPPSTNPPTTQWTSDTREEEDESSEQKSDGEITADEVALPFPEAKEPAAPVPNPHSAAVALTGTVAAEQDDKEGKESTQADVTEAGETAGQKDGPPAISAPTSVPSVIGDASCMAIAPASQTTPVIGSTPKFTTAYTVGIDDPGLPLPESKQMSLSNKLLFDEVFKIQEVDHKAHLCRGLDAQGAQCKSTVPRCHSLGIKHIENSLGPLNGIRIKEIQSLALYNMCDVHTKESAKLAKEWIRLALITKAARQFWRDQQRPITAEKYPVSRKRNAEFAVAEVRRVLAQDESARRVEKEKTELYDESQKKLSWLRTKVETIETEGIPAEELNHPFRKKFLEFYDEIFALEQHKKDLADEISSLKEARDSIDLAHQAETQRYSLEAMDARSLHKESQNEIEALRKDLAALTSKVGEMATENSSLKEDIETVEDVLLEERKRGQQDLQHARDLYESSQRDLEALRKEVDTLNSCISELTTKESSLTDSLDSTQDALIKEKAHSRELEIRLEELRIKPQHSPETKLEKYLREELDKCQRQVLQQQKDFERMRDDYVQLQITNASLETQVKQVEAVKEELNRASNKEVQELTERNSDLLTQLHHTRAQFEQLKAGLAAMERENGGEASKSKFSLRDIYRRPKHEASRLLTPPAD